MKLIIDVPNEVLKSRHYCQYFGAWSTKLTETIENGIPYEERPQGEWMRKINPYSGAYQLKCSVCKKWGGLTDKGYNHEFNFCPNCGAKMQKGGAE